MTPPDTSNAHFTSRCLDRRSFLHKAGLMAAMTPAAAMLLGVRQEAMADKLPFPIGTELDLAILNFALNLEYFEGEYYSLGAYGKSLADQGLTLTGDGTQGTLTVKASPQVPFDTPALKQYAPEIANDEIAHIKFIQTTIAALGGTPSPSRTSTCWTASTSSPTLPASPPPSIPSPTR